MVFSSVIFLCFFLPVVYLLHTCMPNVRTKNTLLTIASLLFYAYGEPIFVFVLLFTVLLHYAAGLLVLKKTGTRKAVLTALILFDVFLLTVFKYIGFFTGTLNSFFGLRLPVPQIGLPIGISFFTFQIMSYAVDFYRDSSVIQRRFSDLLLYVSFCPQLIAGPIIRYNDISAQIASRQVTVSAQVQGLRRFIFGLSKKVILSNTMAAVADSIFALGQDEITMPLSYLASAVYAMQIFYDFSGYSDMAIGMGKIFGFEFPENFNYPYSALSITDFWRRWHISLTSWFREYVYIPLGGNRKGLPRTVLHIFIIFLLTGLWHGAAFTFVIWGLYHAVFMAAERIGIIPVEKIKFKPIKWLYTVFVAFTGFLIFRAESLSQSWSFIKALFRFDTLVCGLSEALRFLDPYFILMLLLAVVFSFPVGKIISDKFGKKRSAQAVSCITALFLLVVSMFLLITDSYNPFIYFNF